jgi:pilus assembly protein CpaE
MSGALRISICDPNEKTRETLKRFLVGTDNVWLEADCSRYDFFIEIVQQTQPDVAIINLDSDESKVFNLIENLTKSASACKVMVVSQRIEGQLILRAIRAGACEYLTSPLQISELVAALDRVASGAQGSGRGGSSHSLIAVAGSSGGIGTTSLAVNLAVALAQNKDRNVALIDLDLALGDADVFLDLIPEYTLIDVARNVSRLDLSLMRKSLIRHETGVYLLPRPVQVDQIARITQDDFSKMLGLLKASFSHLVFDLSKTYGPLDLLAMQAATDLVLVTQLDLPCLRNVVRLLASFESQPGLLEKVKIVVNRSGLDKSHISFEKAEETLDREIFWRIPNNYAAVAECRNNGVPLIQHAPRAAITLSINELAEKLVGSHNEAGGENGNRKDKKGWLKFLGK